LERVSQTRTTGFVQVQVADPLRGQTIERRTFGGSGSAAPEIRACCAALRPSNIPADMFEHSTFTI